MGRTGFVYYTRKGLQGRLRILIQGLIGTYAFSFGSAAFCEKLLDQIAATVNGQVILQSEVKEKVEKGPLITISDYPSKGGDSEYSRALNDKINLMLILDEAADLEIEIPDSQVETEIKRFMDQQGLSESQLKEFLANEGKSYDSYKEDFRRKMIIYRFQGRVIFPSVKITDKDLETYYLDSSSQSLDLIELNLAQILFKIPTDGSSQMVKAKEELATDVLAKLSEGELEFETAAKLYSDDGPVKMEGIRLDDLAPQIKEAVKNTEEGKFAGPIRTGMGIHIFLVEKRGFVKSPGFKKQRAKLESELRNRESAKQLQKWLVDKRRASRVEILN